MPVLISSLYFECTVIKNEATNVIISYVERHNAQESKRQKYSAKEEC